MTPWADLHTHTTYSDGSVTPAELFTLAKKIGLQAISITDHDTIEAYDEAIDIAKKMELRLGTGVELSCHFHGKSLHLLGYDFDPKSGPLRALCQRHHQRRAHRNRAILEKLAEHGMPIVEEELNQRAKTIGRPHIAELMVEKHYVKTIREAFIHYIGEGQKCYVVGEPFLIDEAIETLHQAGGKAFIAHPQLLPKDLPIDELLRFPFDGIECYYSRLSSKPWVEIATKKKWLISGGSDFHGAIKPAAHLASGGVTQEMFKQIFQRTYA